MFVIVEPCPITLPVVKLADLPKAEDYNVEKVKQFHKLRMHSRTSVS